MANFKSLQFRFCLVRLLLIGYPFFVLPHTFGQTPANPIVRPGQPGFEGLQGEVQVVVDPDTGQIAFGGDPADTAIVRKAFENLPKQTRKISKQTPVHTIIRPGQPGVEGLQGEVRIVVDQDTGQVTLLGDPADTAIVRKSFEEISKQASKPKVERILLNNVSGEEIAELVQEIYDTHYAEKHGVAIVRPLKSPNGLHVFGSPKAIHSVRALTNVMGFVHENHPKMETMLLALGESKPGYFRAAIKRTGKTLSKMRSIKDKQPKRYAASVELWKVKSEIEILTARLAKQDDPELRSQLDGLVEKFVDKRKRLLEIEKRNMEHRLERMNRLLETIETDRDAFVKKNLRSVDRTIKQLNSDKSVKKQTGPQQ